MQINVDRQNEWQKLIEEQTASGLSKAAFCKQKGIKPERFYYYADALKKLKHNKINTLSEFVPIEVKKSVAPHKNFESRCVRLILKNGIECVLPDEIDHRRIKEVVEVLLQC